MTKPRRSWPPRASSPRETRRKTPCWRLASRTTRLPAGWPRASKACAKSWKATRTPQRRAWRVLARYLEADAKLPEAVRAADRAIAIDPRSIPAWTLAARVRESAGSLGDAADGACAAWPRSTGAIATEHLTGIARIESRLGRTDAALKAGRDLLAAAPGNPENYEFFAQLCFQLGRPEEGLDALRRAVRANPNDTKIILRLAETLAGQYQTEEAIEIYWRAFDRTDRPRHKLEVVRKLTELYLPAQPARPALDAAPAPGARRPRRRGPRSSDSARQRDVAMCMAQALAASGDLGGARSELERLLAANTRDTHFAPATVQARRGRGRFRERRPISKTAQRPGARRRGDHPAGRNCTRVRRARGSAGALGEDGRRPRARPSASTRRWTPCCSHRSRNRCSRSPSRCVRKDPRDWEALYRNGAALAALDKSAEAARAVSVLARPDESMTTRRALSARRRRQSQADCPRHLAAGEAVAARTSTGGTAGQHLLDPHRSAGSNLRDCRGDTSGRRPTSVRHAWPRWAGS